MDRKPRVLLTNDDGPPGIDSPYVFGFAKHLALDLGWDVKVVIPSSQKSWIGKAYQIKEITKGRYYYPRDPDGHGDVSHVSRPLKRDEGEFAEWILLDGTPATCANIGLHNIYKDGIDLVVSGPNLGRNSSAAFALSSGTIGAALSSSLSRCRAVAISYGTVQHPVPKELFQPAHVLGGKIIQALLRDWGVDKDGIRNNEVDLYNINIPMIDNLLEQENSDPEKQMPIVWTSIWRNAYGSLFKPHTLEQSNAEMPAGGPDARITASRSSPGDGVPQNSVPDISETKTPAKISSPPGPSDHKHGYEFHSHAPELVFKFAPDMSGLIGRRVKAPPGSDAWAIERGWVSVTPLRATFAEPSLDWDDKSTAIVDECANNPQLSDIVPGNLDPGVRFFKL